MGKYTHASFPVVTHFFLVFVLLVLFTLFELYDFPVHRFFSAYDFILRSQHFRSVFGFPDVSELVFCAICMICSALSRILFFFFSFFFFPQKHL